MGTGGWAQGGASIASPSRVFDNTPTKNYRDLDPWFEEFVNAIGAPLEIWNQRFVNAQARANLLDPTYTPVDAPSAGLATATAAAAGWPNQDTMLDVLAFIALAQYPLSSSLTIAQKQAMVAVGWELLSRKGNRIKLLKLVSKMTDGVIYGWTLPPSQFSFILPDGAPDAGYGDWVPQPIACVGTVSVTSGSATVTGSGTTFSATWVGYKIRFGTHTYWIQAVASGTSLTLSANAAATVAAVAFSVIPSARVRPWLFEAIRNVTAVAFPAFVLQGIGYSQYRAGYSAAGDPVLPLGARLCALTDEHFASWSGGALVSWSTSGTGTYAESQTDAFINHEFANSCVQVDLTSAVTGTTRTIYQACKVNNQFTYRAQFDYAYTNAQGVSSLRAYVKDVTNGTYYDPIAGTWGTKQYFALPVSDAVPTRTRYAIDVPPQAATSTTLGTASLEIGYAAISDGTATTQVVYHLYRIGLYDKFDEDIETAFDGDAIGYWPLVDAFGYSAMSRSSATLIEPANYNRSAVRLVTGSNGATFDYHPALNGRGFRATSSWTNLLKGSSDFVTNWTAIASSSAISQTTSPILGEVSPTASTVVGVLVSSVYTAAAIAQTTTTTPTSKS